MRLVTTGQVYTRAVGRLATLVIIAMATSCAIVDAGGDSNSFRTCDFPVDIGLVDSFGGIGTGSNSCFFDGGPNLFFACDTDPEAFGVTFELFVGEGGFYDICVMSGVDGEFLVGQDFCEESPLGDCNDENTCSNFRLEVGNAFVYFAAKDPIQCGQIDIMVNPPMTVQ